MNKLSNFPVSLENIETRLIKNSRVNTAIENDKDKISSNKKDREVSDNHQYGHIYYNYNSSYNQELAR